MMYLQHFGLREAPFSITPDTAYFFSYGHYADALNTLLVALRSGEGFIKVTGEVGTGKTLLCRKLLNSMDKEFVSAYIPNPQLSPYGLQAGLASELGIALSNRPYGHHQLQKMITDRLVELTSEGKKVVLCLDEAQAMPTETLETLRLLTNLETEKYKLLQVVLFGQPELDERLNTRQVRQLKQRITFSYRLEPIDREGLDSYVSHRLVVAGYQGGALFEHRAMRTLYKCSRGIPRLINILSHKAMMAAYGRGDTTVDEQHMRLAVKDTEDAQLSHPPRRHWPWWLAAVTVLVSVALLYWQGDRLQGVSL
ncbi:MAG: AAA family ATPase [Thiohalophilus sp.]|nr:AAA family ATPase [Thiohalophilus sp.]MDZ7803679.1 AAA family ATPase [Thiohalophilus sp.]